MNYDQIASYYDLTHAEQSADIALILSLVSGEHRTVLELGCGTGRIALPLARAGCTVVGLDKSQEMLLLARKKLDREPVDLSSSILWVEGDLTSFQLGQKFDLVTLSHNTLHELTRDGVRAVFRQIREHLKADGMVFIDLSNPFLYFSHREGDNIWVEDKSFLDPESGYLLHQRSTVSIDPRKQQIRVLRALKMQESESTQGKQLTYESTYDLFYPHEVDLLMDKAGLQLVQLFGGYDREPFGEGSERLLVIARHKSEFGS